MTIPPPPNILLWAAVATFVFRIYVFLSDKWTKRSDRRISVLDDYWYRSVLLPVCVNPLIELCKTCAGDLRKLAADPAGTDTMVAKYQLFQADLATEKNKIVSSFILLTPFSSDICGKIAIILDNFEDALAEYCRKCCSNNEQEKTETVASIAYIEAFLWDSLRAVSVELMDIHQNVPKGKIT